MYALKAMLMLATNRYLSAKTGCGNVPELPYAIVSRMLPVEASIRYTAFCLVGDPRTRRR